VYVSAHRQRLLWVFPDGCRAFHILSLGHFDYTIL
jgi:hypothetical protein